MKPMKRLTQIIEAVRQKAINATTTTFRICKYIAIVCLIVGILISATVYKTIDIIIPHAHNIYSGAKLVYGESRGESREGQKAAFASVLERKADQDFPDTLHEVFFQTYSNDKKMLQYNAMGDYVHEDLSTEVGQQILKRVTWWYVQNELGIFKAPSEAQDAHSYCVKEACERQSAYFGTLEQTGVIGNHVFYGHRSLAPKTSAYPKMRPQSFVQTEQNAQQIDALIAQVIAEGN